MKVSFIHTADLHLGKQFHFQKDGDRFGSEKRRSLWRSFEEILAYAEEQCIDLLLISGDLFDSDEVDLAEIRRTADRLGSLSVTQVVIVAGNHDHYGEGSPYTKVEWPENVTLFKSGGLESVYFPKLKTEVYGLSWIKDTYDAFPITEKVQAKLDRQSILMLHGEVEQTQSPFMPIDLSLFSGMDYVALGHVHQSSLLSKRIAYCGSPEPLNFGEGGNHGFIVGTIEDHVPQVRFGSLTGRKYVTLEVEITPEMGMDDILQKITESASEESRMRDYYRIRLDGLYDVDLDLSWILSEIRSQFYYVEVDDSRLSADVDINALIAEQGDRAVGRFIAMMKDRKDPVSRKALSYCIKGLMDHSDYRS